MNLFPNVNLTTRGLLGRDMNSSFQHPAPAKYKISDDCVWRDLHDATSPLHEEKSCERLQKTKSLILPGAMSGVPQPRDVSERLKKASNFGLATADGVVPGNVFFDALSNS